jgi:hypothetical protein
LVSPLDGEKEKVRERTRMTEPADGRGGLPPGFVEPLLSGVRSLASRYIDANERFAGQMLDFQARTTKWAKHTPLGPMFEAQNALGKRLVTFLADSARDFWKVEKRAPDSDGVA